MRTICSNAFLRKGILNAGRRAQRLGAIHTFPWQIDVRSAEMAERGRLTINRATQIQHVDDAGRTKIKLLSDACLKSTSFFNWMSLSLSCLSKSRIFLW